MKVEATLVKNAVLDRTVNPSLMITSGRSLNIVFFGDSIFFGQYISPNHAWISRISETLERRFGTDRVTITNSSISGNTTRMALERMPHDVQGLTIDVLVTQFGMNDCNYWLSDKGLPRVGKRAFIANLHEIFARARACGARKVLCNTNHPTTRTTPFGHLPISYQQSNEEYSELIRTAVREDGSVELIDTEKIWQSKIGSDRAALERLLLPDQLHLSLEGHQVYFESVLEPVSRAVESLIETSSHRMN